MESIKELRASWRTKMGLINTLMSENMEISTLGRCNRIKNALMDRTKLTSITKILMNWITVASKISSIIKSFTGKHIRITIKFWSSKIRNRSFISKQRLCSTSRSTLNTSMEMTLPPTLWTYMEVKTSIK